MPVRSEAATGDALVHGDEAGRHPMSAQPASEARAASLAMARSAEPGASAVVVGIGEAGARGAGTKCRAAMREGRHGEKCVEPIAAAATTGSSRRGECRLTR